MRRFRFLLALLPAATPYSRPVTRTAALRVAAGAASGVLASRGAAAALSDAVQVNAAVCLDLRSNAFDVKRLAQDSGGRVCV